MLKPIVHHKKHFIFLKNKGPCGKHMLKFFFFFKTKIFFFQPTNVNVRVCFFNQELVPWKKLKTRRKGWGTFPTVSTAPSHPPGPQPPLDPPKHLIIMSRRKIRSIICFFVFVDNVKNTYAIYRASKFYKSSMKSTITLLPGRAIFFFLLVF